MIHTDTVQKSSDMTFSFSPMATRWLVCYSVLVVAVASCVPYEQSGSNAAVNVMGQSSREHRTHHTRSGDGSIERGTEVQSVSGQWVLDGQWESVDPQGQVEIVGYYKNGKKDGVWRWYVSQKLVAQGWYETGERQGKWSYWEDNGRLYEEGRYKDDKKDAEWIRWFRDGSRSISHFVSGEREGSFLSLDSQSRLRVLGWYSKDQKVGKWVYWDDRGEIEREESYEPN